MSAESEKQLKLLVSNRILEIQDEWKVSPVVISKIEAPLRAAVKGGLALACMASAWKARQTRAEFLAQIPESIWVALILSLKGHVNPANVALRQAVELFFKHIYFSDHPIEYRWVQQYDHLKEFGYQMLSDYVRRLSESDGFSLRDECHKTLDCVFSECSRYVHMHSSKFFGGEAIQKPEDDIASSFSSVSRNLSRIIPAITALVVIYQYKTFLSLSPVEQRLVRSSWNKSLKDSITVWQRNRSFDVAEKQPEGVMA